jgi:O-phosphoseryl-tRNA(Cys) synthetase
VPLRRLGVEDFVMVGDEKKEKIESYRGTSTEVYVNVS